VGVGGGTAGLQALEEEVALAGAGRRREWPLRTADCIFPAQPRLYGQSDRERVAPSRRIFTSVAELTFAKRPKLVIELVKKYASISSS